MGFGDWLDDTFNDVVEAGEDAWNSGKRALGELVDHGSDLLADGLDKIDLDDAAEWLRNAGDEIADELGATPDEEELGDDSHDPRKLVHGDPGLIRDRAGKLTTFSGHFTSAGQGLQAISAGDFRGDFADAYERRTAEEYPKWFVAADACNSASGALNNLAGAVQFGQDKAKQAIQVWQEGIRLHNQWVKDVAAYNDAVDKHNAGENVTLPPKPSSEDPKKAKMDEARRILNEGREHRNTVATSAAGTLNDAAGQAPEMPPAGDRMLMTLSDLKMTADMFSGHALVGLTGALTDTVKLVRTVNPTDPYNVAHPAQYLANSTSVANGLVDMAANPEKLVKGLVGDGWGKDPGQAFGAFASNFLPGPKGSGLARNVLKDALRNAPRAGADDLARTSTHALGDAPRPHGTGTPSASPSPHSPAPDPVVSTHTGPAPQVDAPHTGGAPDHTPPPSAPEPQSVTPSPEVRAPDGPGPGPGPGGPDPGGPGPGPEHSYPPADAPPVNHTPDSHHVDQTPTSPHTPDSTPTHPQGTADHGPTADRTPDGAGNHTPERAGEPAVGNRTPETAPDRAGQHPDGDAHQRPPGDADSPHTRDHENRQTPHDRVEATRDHTDGPARDRVDHENPLHPKLNGENPLHPKVDGENPVHPRGDSSLNGERPTNAGAPPPVAPVHGAHPASSNAPDGPRPTTDAPRAEAPRTDAPRDAPNKGDGPTPRDSPTNRDAPTGRDGATNRDAPGAKPSAPDARPAGARPDAPDTARADRAASPDRPNADGPDATKIEPVAAVVPPGRVDPPNAVRPHHDSPASPNGDHPDLPDAVDQHPTPNHDVVDDARDPARATELQDSTTCGDPVDMATGEYVLPAVDVALPAVLPLRLTRSHRSQYRHGVWLGPTWSCTFDARVVITEEAITTIDADGTMLLFDPPPDDEPSVARHGRPWQLWATASNGYRLVSPQGGLAYHFEPKPHLGGADLADGVIFISAITDGHHNRMLFTYTNTGAPSGVVHSAGYRIGVDCDGFRIRGYSLATDTATTVLRRFGYTDGNLTSYTDAAGATSAFEYDGHRRMVAWTDSIGARYENVYDDEGRVLSQGGRDGVWAGVFSYQDDADGYGRTTTYTDVLGAQTVFGFDADLRPRAVADPAGRVTRTDYNVDRDPLRITDAAGASTTFLYTAEGQPAQITDALGRVTRFGYTDTAAGPRVSELTRADGTAVSFTYDDAGDRVGLRDADGGMWRWEYNGSGAVSARVDPLGRRTEYTCNSAGQPVRMVDSAGAETHCRYDVFGNLVHVELPDGAGTAFGYDAAGRMVSRTGPDGSVESWEYDGEGNRVAYTNALGAVTRWEYGFFDLPVARIDADGSRTRFDYDRARRLVAVTNPAGLSWTYRYSPDGKLAAETDFNGAATTYGYDAAGRLASRTNAAGQSVAMSYDAAGQLVSEVSTGEVFGGERVDHVYDPVGRRVACDMPWGRVEFTYDPTGRVVSEAVEGRTVVTVFNIAGEPMEMLTPSGLRSSLTYDRRGVVDALTAGGQRCQITSDVRGRATRVQYGTTAVDSAWNEIGRLTGRRVLAGVRDFSVLDLGSGPVGTESLLAGADYAYRPDDALASVAAVDASVPALGEAARFDTDDLGRLTSRTTAGGVVETTVFDASVNPTVSGPDSGSGWIYDGVRLVDDGRSRYHYDPAGRLSRVVTKRLGRSADVWHYRWDVWDRLREVTTPDGRTVAYTYDAAGRRMSKTSDGQVTEFAWSGSQLVEQQVLTESDVEVTSWVYLPGRFTPQAQIHSRGAVDAARPGELSLSPGSSTSAELSQDEVDRRFYAIVTDQIDTPVALLDPASGQLAGESTSTMWGRASWTGVDTPWRYPGQYHDDETGLHYNRFRYYHPATGRYLTPDPLGLAPAPNPYGYPDNPTTFIDPLGLSECSQTIRKYGPHEVGPLTPSDPGRWQAADEPANTFTGGSYSEKVTTEPMTLYRAYTAGAHPLGGYWSRDAPTGPIQARIDSALNPAWGNQATAVSTIQVPAGITFFEGTAAPQHVYGGGVLIGGGSQIVFEPGFRVPSSWLK